LITLERQQAQHRVVSNDEGQYSYWPVERPLPAGWYDVGIAGSKQDCLSYIERVWQDQLPRSLRQ